MKVVGNAIVCGLFSLCSAVGAEVSPARANLPPRNPYLADSHNPIGHGDPAQQDSQPMAGPIGQTRALRPEEIAYVPVGPAHFGAFTSGLYRDGRRVAWSNGLDRIAKVDQDSFKILATYYYPDVRRYSEEEAEKSIEKFNASNEGYFAIRRAAKEAKKLRDLSRAYTLLDRDNTYYISDASGTITAYGDVDPGDPASAIEAKRVFRFPERITGLPVGMNMTYDGWLVVVTQHGHVVSIKRDFTDYRHIRMLHSDATETNGAAPTMEGWVRNGHAIDQEGGIYIVSRQHMHKVIWTGDRLSTAEADGAWTVSYPNGTGRGSGATPTLMGFGEEDQLVVITDGDPLMNLVLFWRNGIPEDWRQLAHVPSRRIAGIRAVNMGDPNLGLLQSEQSVVVAGYGALVVNNTPRNKPWYLPKSDEFLLSTYLGSSPRYQPLGMQKFEWDPQTRKLEEAWVNTKVSAPNCVALVSHGSDTAYFIGARNNRWVLEALNWQTGESRFHFVIGDQRYNTLFGGTLLDERGRINFGTTWGRARLDPQ